MKGRELEETADADGSAPTLPSSPTSSAESAPVPSIVAGRYEILGLLGVGGMGRVYRVRDTKLDEIVALKTVRGDRVVSAEMLERFRQEVKLARRVTSEHVVRTFDLVDHESGHFLTMEYIEGQSLSKLVDNGPLAIDDALRIVRAACAGIAAAHAAGVLHRDLKPDNILVGHAGRIAITDFGIAVAIGGGTAGELAGTPAYMAPEQVRGATIGPAADVYALGAILFEMLTGRRPFEEHDALALSLARLHEAAPDPRQYRDMPAELAELVNRCLATDPAVRPNDGRALAAELARIANVVETRVDRAPDVPNKSATTIAVAPIVSSAELADLSNGFCEELVDALTMTRDLRVRPYSSSAPQAELDVPALGARLGVDALVVASLRPRGDGLRVTARVVGVADGFQLWANHFETSTDRLLATADEVARAVAGALVIELPKAARAPVNNARAVELYLESKAQLHASWYIMSFPRDILAKLEEAHVLAPDDPGILALYAVALSRAGFIGATEDQQLLQRATVLARRAVAIAPTSGEAWFSSGYAAQVRGAMAEAVTGFRRALQYAPGLALAQQRLGALLLEAGELERAEVHVEAAVALDPRYVPAAIDRARIAMYRGRSDEAIAQLAALPYDQRFVDQAVARYRMWCGQMTELAPVSFEKFGTPRYALWAEAIRRIHSTRTMSPEDRAYMESTVRMETPMRSVRAQFLSEFLVFVGEPDAAMQYLELAVDSGSTDFIWFSRCPLLDGFRGRPEFAALVRTMAARAASVVDAANAPL